MLESETIFYEWWERDGRFIDPDTSDVPWVDKRHLLALRAFIAGTAAWQPIENAPTDGTRIIVWLPLSRLVCIAHGFDRGWRDEQGNKIRPTHFMFLPKSPEMVKV